MGSEGLTRRGVLRSAALATTALAAPFVRRVHAAEKVVPSGSMVLGWHTNIAPRWLDPLQHDGGATPDNFLNVVQDALIKNFYDKLYDHLAIAERYEFAEDAKSATFWLRPGLKFHNGAPSPPRTSNGATSITEAPGGRCCMTRPRVSKSWTTPPSASISSGRSPIFHS